MLACWKISTVDPYTSTAVTSWGAFWLLLRMTTVLICHAPCTHCQHMVLLYMCSCTRRGARTHTHTYTHTHTHTHTHAHTCTHAHTHACTHTHGALLPHLSYCDVLQPRWWKGSLTACCPGATALCGLSWTTAARPTPILESVWDYNVRPDTLHTSVYPACLSVQLQFKCSVVDGCAIAGVQIAGHIVFASWIWYKYSQTCRGLVL